jgi:hypothetical protein
MRVCLTAQGERFTRAGLTVGQDCRVVAIKAGGEEGGDTGLVDCRLEGGREGGEEKGGRDRERDGERGSNDMAYDNVIYVSSRVHVPTPE